MVAMVTTSRYKQNQIANEQHDHTNQGTDHQGILDIAEFHVFTSCSSKQYQLLGLTLTPHRAYCVSRSTRRICSEGNSRLLPPDPPGVDCGGRAGREGGCSVSCFTRPCCCVCPITASLGEPTAEGLLSLLPTVFCSFSGGGSVYASPTRHSALRCLYFQQSNEIFCRLATGCSNSLKCFYGWAIFTGFNFRQMASRHTGEGRKLVLC